MYLSRRVRDCSACGYSRSALRRRRLRREPNGRARVLHDENVQRPRLVKAHRIYRERHGHSNTHAHDVGVVWIRDGCVRDLEILWGSQQCCSLQESQTLDDDPNRHVIGWGMGRKGIMRNPDREKSGGGYAKCLNGAFHTGKPAGKPGAGDDEGLGFDQ